MCAVFPHKKSSVFLFLRRSARHFEKWRADLQKPSALPVSAPTLYKGLTIDILILEEKCMKKRILSLLLVFVMLLSLLPAGVLAAEGDVSVTLSGMHDAQVKSLKLYTYMDG